MQEYGFVLQFTAISICSTFTWISFIVYPKIIPAAHPEWYAFVALGMIINCAVTSVSCLCFNKDLKRASLELLKCKKYVHDEQTNMNFSAARFRIDDTLNDQIMK